MPFVRHVRPEQGKGRNLNQLPEEEIRIGQMVQDTKSYGNVERAVGVASNVPDIPELEGYIVEAKEILSEKATSMVVPSTFHRHYLVCPGAGEGECMPSFERAKLKDALPLNGNFAEEKSEARIVGGVVGAAVVDAFEREACKPQATFVKGPLNVSLAQVAPGPLKLSRAQIAPGPA